jgi:hypothetical protein
MAKHAATGQSRHPPGTGDGVANVPRDALAFAENAGDRLLGTLSLPSLCDISLRRFLLPGAGHDTPSNRGLGDVGLRLHRIRPGFRLMFSEPCPGDDLVLGIAIWSLINGVALRSVRVPVSLGRPISRYVGPDQVYDERSSASGA